MAQFERLPPRQALQVLGQIILGRHLGAVDEYGDDRNIPPKRRRDLDANIVLVAVQLTATLIVFQSQPMRPDQGEHDVHCET